MANRLVAPESDVSDLHIRPRRLKDFVGQKDVCDSMEVFIKAAFNRGEAMDHVMLYGPPGLGKTTLASIVASELGVNCRTTSAQLLTKAGDLAAILTKLTPKDVLFIDEIHRLNAHVEEVLYSAMEDFVIDIIIGSGPTARNLRLDLNPFTLVGATTRFGMLSGPLRDRFGIAFKLDLYQEQELVLLIQRAALVLNLSIDSASCYAIAIRSRGTPRISLRLLKRVRDFAEVSEKHLVTEDFVKEVLERLGIDSIGLDKNDYMYMGFIAKYYPDSPVGIETIVAGLSESKESVEEIIEPYLLRIGFISRTSRGRLISKEAIKYLSRNQIYIKKSE